MLDPEAYRNALRRFPGGVTIVTAAHEGTAHGLTATAFSPVSLKPPLVLVCLEKGSRTRALTLESGRFVVNMLSETQIELARRFATKGAKSFEDVPHALGSDGIPQLTDAISVLACSTVSVIEAGDHDVFLAEVTAADTAPGEPLVYYDRAYRVLDLD